MNNNIAALRNIVNTYLRGLTLFTLRDFYNDYYHSVGPGVTKEVIRQALILQKQSVDRAIKQVEDVNDREIKKLLDLTGVGFAPIVKILNPQLVKPSKTNSSEMSLLVDDRVARSYVLGIEELSSHWHAVKELSEADTDVLLALGSLLPFAPVNLVGKVAHVAARIALGAADVADMAFRTVPQMIEQKKEADFAKTTIGILDQERLDMAEASEVPMWMNILAIGGATYGLADDFADAVRGVNLMRTRARADSLLTLFNDGGIRQIQKMTKQDQSIFCAAMADAKDTTNKGGAEALTNADKVRQRRFAEAADRLKSQVDEMLDAKSAANKGGGNMSTDPEIGTPKAKYKHGNWRTMNEHELGVYAKNPPVKTKGRPSRISEFTDSPLRAVDRRSDFVEARSSWVKLDLQVRIEFDKKVRSAIDEAAALGDKWAKRLQKDINDGIFDYAYEPRLNASGLAPKDGPALINPLRGGDSTKLTSADEAASTLIHEYVHKYKGGLKYRAANDLPYSGSPIKGEYNEIRAFMAEARFNMVLQKARSLNGGTFDDTILKELKEMMGVDELPKGLSQPRRGQTIRENMQRSLVEDYPYGVFYANSRSQQAIHLSTFGGGSRRNIRQYLRNARGPDGEHTAEYEAILKKIKELGGETQRKGNWESLAKSIESTIPKRITKAKQKFRTDLNQMIKDEGKLKPDEIVKLEKYYDVVKSPMDIDRVLEKIRAGKVMNPENGIFRELNYNEKFAKKLQEKIEEGRILPEHIKELKKYNYAVKNGMPFDKALKRVEGLDMVTSSSGKHFVNKETGHKVKTVKKNKKYEVGKYESAENLRTNTHQINVKHTDLNGFFSGRLRVLMEAQTGIRRDQKKIRNAIQKKYNGDIDLYTEDPAWKKAHTNMINAAENIGEIAGRAIMRKIGATKLTCKLPGRGKSGEFDLVYKYGKEIFIIEAKGGSAGLGHRMTKRLRIIVDHVNKEFKRAGVKVHQLTTEYILTVMINMDSKLYGAPMSTLKEIEYGQELAETVRKIATALQDGKVRCLQVSQRIDMKSGELVKHVTIEEAVLGSIAPAYKKSQ